MTNILRRYLFAILSLVTLSNCASVPANEDLSRAHIVAYQGFINQNFYELVVALPNKATLVIDSQGGSRRFGILAGREIQDKQINVSVRGDCLSSCANYIATASPNLTLQDDSVLGFHGTTFNFGPKNNSDLRDLPMVEALFLESGIDLDLIFCAEKILFTGEFEVKEIQLEDGTIRRAHYPVVRKKMWIPSIEVMEKYGLKISGTQPGAASDVARIIGGNRRADEIEMDGGAVDECASA